MEIDKINRSVFFMHAQILDTEETSRNTTWVYKRAPEGYAYQLVEAVISVTAEENSSYGIFNIYDGHEYTHWNIYPGVVSHELLGRIETRLDDINHHIQLHHWECKEYTLAVRSTHEANPVKMCIIIWYYLKKMSKLETFKYAIRHPKWRIRKGSASTLDYYEES